MGRGMLSLGFVLLAAAAGGGARQSEPPKDRQTDTPVPLAGLPSASGPQGAKSKGLADDAGLDLGSPAADPKWGKARGRSWCAPMPYAPNLSGGFLYGEGVHGYTKPDGRYMDDLWFYDINAHR